MNVVFSLTAERDLGGLVSYITNDLQNPGAARNIATKILQRSQSLSSFPEMGVLLGNIDHRLDGYRYLVVDNYLLIYKVIGSEVAIIRILYARSDYIQLVQG